MKMKYPKTFKFGNETYRFDSKHDKQKRAISKSNKIRWTGYKTRIKFHGNSYLVYKGRKRNRW
jgi:hypothetical protein